jgi:hypothetical protein
MAARFDIEKPIFTPEQIAGHAEMWAADAIEKYPYLLINPLLDPVSGQKTVAPIGYTKAPNMPPAMAALAQLAAQALDDMLGNQEAGEQLQPNQSGKAVELIQQRLDMQVFIYIDNFKKMVKQVGHVWQSMASELLHEPGRKMKTIDQADQTGTIQLMKPMINKETGERYLANDLSKARFDVVPDVGPSSSSRRAATVRGLTGVLQMVSDPQDQAVLTAMIMMNMEGEGMGDIRAYYRNKLVRIGVIEPTDEEKQELEAEQQQTANAPPDPDTQFLQASAVKAMADAQAAQAKTALTAAQVDKTRADTVVALAGVEQDRADHALAVAQHLGDHQLARDQMTQQAAQRQAAQAQSGDAQ